jgi:hypothetical protein
MKVIAMKLSIKEKRRQYRIIYESLYQNARVSITDISMRIGSARITASNRVKDAFEYGYITRPQIRKRSYANLKQYMFFVDCKDPVELYLQYREDQNVVYHAVMDGFANLWVTSLDKMIIQGNILVGGPVSDMHVSFAPTYSWEEAKRIMWEKVERFDPADYEPKGIIQTHYDEQIEWGEEDEILYRYFKYDLRKPLDPIARKNHISDQRAWDWLKKLPECCSIITKYYPQTRAAYDPYIFFFETDYEDFIIELFSEMPSSGLFFRVADTLVLFVQVERELLRRVDSDITEITQLHIPLLTRSLLKKGIVKSRAHALVNYHWRKDI